MSRFMLSMISHLWLVLLLCGAIAANKLAVANESPVVINDQVRDLPLDYLEVQIAVFRQSINEQSEIVIEGENRDTEPRIVILRFDDDKSYNYISRLNIERVVIPGPFKIQVPLFGQKTPNGRLFEWQSWKRFILFTDNAQRPVVAGNITLNHAANYSSRSFGFDLGNDSSPVLTGMTQITADFAGIKGKYLSARRFASGNALITDGIEGIESLTLDIPNGSYDVTLWFMMEGLWENLPRQLEQRISVQGQSALNRVWTPQQWLENHYLMAEDKEAWLEGSPWEIFGDNAYQRLITIAEVTDGKLVINMNGRTTHDNYLAGVFVSPTDLAGADTQLLLNAIQNRFEQKWQVVNSPESSNKRKHDGVVKLKQVLFDRYWQPDIEPILNRSPIVVNKDGFAVIDFAATGTHLKEQVKVELKLINSAGEPVNLPAQMRKGMWRYQRPQGSSTLLSLSANELRSIDSDSLVSLDGTLARRINLFIPMNDAVKGQTIQGILSLVQGNDTIAFDRFFIDVLDVKLPKVRQKVGIYQEKAVHWGWFNQLENSHINLACDYEFIEQLGLNALSPPLSTPRRIYEDTTAEQLRDSLLPYIRDLNLYHQYFDTPAVDYTTIKRFWSYYQYKPQLLHRHLRALVTAINEQQLPMPQFAIADEVEELNADQLSEFSEQIGQLQNAMSSAVSPARLLGQLNKPANLQLTPMMDTLLINQGFGVSQSLISDLQNQGKSVWMYNMKHKRLAAGFYMWQSNAQGYLQWHGRMPTGQPFNPLDGREADFQMFYPSLSSCSQQLDINAELLDIAEGAMDRRWVNWLIKQARIDNQAKKLLARLRHQIPEDWQDTYGLAADAAHKWRNEITALARKTSK